MKLTKQEQETIVLYNESESTASIYTHSIKMKNRLERYAAKHPKLAVLKQQDEYGAVTYEVPKKRLTVMLTEPMSEERLQAYRERGHSLQQSNTSAGTLPAVSS